MITIQKIMDVIVDRLQDIMKEKSWDINDLAVFLNIPRRTVNSWILKERTPRIDYIYHIAEKLEITIDYLVGREN